MKAVKILHTGDLHLGSSFAHSKLPKAIGKARRQELWETFNEIVEIVKREGIQLLLIAGDLLEYNYCSTADIRRIDRKFREIADVHVCIAPGNHDPAVSDSFYNTYSWSSNVHIFGKRELQQVHLEDIGVSVWGIGWDCSEIKEPLLEGFCAADAGNINVLLLHCDVVSRGKTSPYLPVFPDQLANCGFHYAALGHIHKAGEIVHQGRVVARYCGSPEPLDFSEPGQHGVYIGSLSRDMCQIQFRPVARRQFIRDILHVEPSYTVDTIAEAIRERVAQNGDNNLYKFELAGNTEPGTELDTGYLASAAGAFFAWVEDNTHPDYYLEAITREGANNISSIFASKILSMLEEERDPGKRRVLERALYMGLDALNGRRVIIK